LDKSGLDASALTGPGFAAVGLGKLGWGELGWGELGLGELGLGELGLVELGLVELGLVELGLNDAGCDRPDLGSSNSPKSSLDKSNLAALLIGPAPGGGLDRSVFLLELSDAVCGGRLPATRWRAVVASGRSALTAGRKDSEPFAGCSADLPDADPVADEPRGLAGSRPLPSGGVLPEFTAQTPALTPPWPLPPVYWLGIDPTPLTGVRPVAFATYRADLRRESQTESAGPNRRTLNVNMAKRGSGF
jgi:GLTT repeat (6 copies)